MTTRSVAPSARRGRRSPDEVRRLLLESAQERFASHGYAGASTKAIAAEAGLSEALIFNHFGTKAGLFQAAVLEPFAAFIEDYVSQYRETPFTADLETETRLYVSGMYDLFRRHRKLVLALAAAEAFDQDGLSAKVNNTFANLLTPIVDMVGKEFRGRGWKGVDAPIIVRALLGMIMSMTVLDNLLYEHGARRPADDRVVDQLTRLLVDGYHGLREPAPTRRPRPRSRTARS